VDKRWHHFILGVADGLNGFTEAMKVSKSGLAASSCFDLDGVTWENEGGRVGNRS
jgi:hypothetical protein